MLSLRLSDGAVAPAVLVDGTGRILGNAKGPKGPGGAPPPIDLRVDEIVGARRADGAVGRLGLSRWHARPAPGDLHRRIRAWSPDPADPQGHLQPLIRFLVLHGNRLHRDQTADDGKRKITLVDAIDFVAVRAEFEVPPSIELHPAHDAIVCRHSRCEILGTRGARR
jgi:hypothetical protein